MRNKTMFKLYGVGLLLAAGLMTTLLLIESMDLDPDMIHLSRESEILEGVVTNFKQEGVEVLVEDGKGPTVYTPIIQINEDSNPALGFKLLVNSYSHGKRICFRTVHAVDNDEMKVAYNFHKCGNIEPETSVSPGKHQYVSTLRGYDTATLIGYKDGTRAGDKGRSQLAKNKYIVLSLGNKIIQMERSNTFGFPNGRYRADDVGRRFCVARHELVSAKFDSDLRSIGLWVISNPGLYLWSCKAADLGRVDKYSDFFE